MRRLVLLEDYPSGFQPEPGDSVVALSAKACFWLDKHKQSYSTAGEYGSEIELRNRESQYWKEQVAWLDGLDDMLWGHVPELKARRIRPAIVYGRHLKGLLDSIFIRCAEATSVLTRPCDLVALWPGIASEPWPTSMTDTIPDCTLNALVWPVICAHRGLPYQEHPCPSQRASATQIRLAWLRTVARSGTEKVRAWWRYMCATGGLVLAEAVSPARRLTLLFVETSYDLGDLMNTAYLQGHRCLLLRGDRLVDVSVWPIGGGARRLASGPNERLRRRVRDAAEAICAPTSTLWRWTSTWFDFPVTNVLLDFVKQWIVEQVPQLIAASDRFGHLYEQEAVDFVLAPSINSPMQAAAVAACGGSDRAKGVLIAHGDGPDVAEAWDLHELFSYDHYFVPDSEFADYFRQRKLEYVRPTARVHVGSGRWHEYTRWSRRPYVYWERRDTTFPIVINRPPGRIPTDKPIVVYAVTGLEGDRRYLNHPSYSETWYYRLQSHIIQALLSSNKFTIVVKLYPGQDHQYRSLVRFIAETGATNIYVSRAAMKSWVPWANRFILDKPSTTLYQIALARVPFHLLLYRGLKMREAAIAKFREHLTSFEEFEEAADAVRRFLAVPVSRRPVLTPEGPEILTTLTTLAQARGGTVGRS